MICGSVGEDQEKNRGFEQFFPCKLCKCCVEAAFKEVSQKSHIAEPIAIVKLKYETEIN